ncbi:hypothetical protein GCM10023210_05020 [Chryseobacterium ginsengisoli]|uniref:Uncharacterized protein n=2 Tax=Chryseobacterium ginsengisoli TaxID=363853 RepID=A0ABP9LWD9_9FLAO
MLVILPLNAQNNIATANGVWNNCATWSSPPAIYNNSSSNKVINAGVNVTLNSNWYAQGADFAALGEIDFQGTNWLDFTGSGTDQTCIGTIATLSCNGGTQSDNTITEGQAIVAGATRTIPYTGGNGGSYPAGSWSANGITANLPAGNFAVGNGNLIFNLSGTPTTNGTINIPISVAGINCNLTVNVLVPVPLTITSVGFNIAPNYPVSYGNVSYYHNSSSPAIWNGSYTTAVQTSSPYQYNYSNGIRVVATSGAPIYFPGATVFYAAANLRMVVYAGWIYPGVNTLTWSLYRVTTTVNVNFLGGMTINILGTNLNFSYQTIKAGL